LYKERQSFTGRRGKKESHACNIVNGNVAHYLVASDNMYRGPPATMPIFRVDTKGCLIQNETRKEKKRRRERETEVKI